MPHTARHGSGSGRAAIYLTNLLVSFHYFLVVYINSAFLSRFVDAQQLSILYVAGSVLSVALFSYFAALVRRAGNYRLMLIFTILEVAAIAGMALGSSAAVVIAAFLLYLTMSPVIYLNLDIFLEKSVTNEGITGGVRGMFLTMSNITQVVCPLLAGLLLYDNAYGRVYLVSIVFLLAVLVVVVGYLRRFSDARYHPRTVWQSAAYVLRHHSLYDAVMAQFLLRFFYAWMVIYTPLYLFQHIGFSWQQIGVMFSIMLLPFLLLELPLGRMADRRWGEKEMMTLGFVLMAATVAVMPFITAPLFVVWTATLFMSRVGASLVEISTETYFFKHVDGALADTISLFRMARPLTYIAASAIAALALQLISLQWSFLILAVVMVWGLRYALALQDTK